MVKREKLSVRTKKKEEIEGGLTTLVGSLPAISECRSRLFARRLKSVDADDAVGLGLRSVTLPGNAGKIGRAHV